MNIKGVALGLALAALACPASALVYTLNISGNIISGHGPSGQEVLGPQFTALFRVDTAKDPKEGITWSVQSPSLTASYAPPVYLDAWASPGDSYSRPLDLSWAYAGGVDSYFEIGRGHEVEDYLWDPDDYYNGGLDLGQYQYLELNFYFDGIPGFVGPDGIPTNQTSGSNADILGYLGFYHAYSGGGLSLGGPGPGFTLRGNSYNVDVAVPEPNTWALMIGGFGLAGATLRRHRRQALAA